MKYVVFEDLKNKKFINNPSDLPVKIHTEQCRFYKNRKVKAPTVKWHGSFNTLNEAESYAEQLGKPWARVLLIVELIRQFNLYQRFDFMAIGLLMLWTIDLKEKIACATGESIIFEILLSF